jgi:hypothetical protein
MLRPLRLARIAAEAEGARLRALAHRNGVRAAIGVLAVVFVLMALSFFHIVLWFWMRTSFEWTPLICAVALTVLDLAVAVILGVIASSSKPSHDEEEARLVRQQALDGLRQALTWSALVLPGARMAMGMARRRHQRVGTR